MGYHVIADAVVILHFAFVLFAVLGGLLVFRWRRVAWVHIPAVTWAVLIEFVGWVCPLTPLENWLRAREGGPQYAEGFIDHYIIPVLYPAGLTRPEQLALGAVALAVNVLVYWRVTWRST